MASPLEYNERTCKWLCGPCFCQACAPNVQFKPMPSWLRVKQSYQVRPVHNTTAYPMRRVEIHSSVSLAGPCFFTVVIHVGYTSTNTRSCESDRTFSSNSRHGPQMQPWKAFPPAYWRRSREAVSLNATMSYKTTSLSRPTGGHFLEILGARFTLPLLDIPKLPLVFQGVSHSSGTTKPGACISGRTDVAVNEERTQISCVEASILPPFPCSLAENRFPKPYPEYGN